MTYIYIFQENDGFRLWVSTIFVGPQTSVNASPQVPQVPMQAISRTNIKIGNCMNCISTGPFCPFWTHSETSTVWTGEETNKNANNPEEFAKSEYFRPWWPWCGDPTTTCSDFPFILETNNNRNNNNNNEDETKHNQLFNLWLSYSYSQNLERDASWGLFFRPNKSRFNRHILYPPYMYIYIYRLNWRPQL